MNLFEYVHVGCYGRFRLVLPWNTYSYSSPTVICEKCKKIWDDTSDARESMQRPPKHLKDLIEVDLSEYTSEEF